MLSIVFNDEIKAVAKDGCFGSDGDLTGVERRHRWPVEGKLKIVRESFLPGCSITGLARRYDVCRSQIYQWRRAYHLSWLRADDEVIDFHPVEICDTASMRSDPVVPVEPRGDVDVTISLRGDRAVSFSSTLSCGEIKRLIAAVEQA